MLWLNLEPAQRDVGQIQAWGCGERLYPRNTIPPRVKHQYSLSQIDGELVKAWGVQDDSAELLSLRHAPVYEKVSGLHCVSNCKVEVFEILGPGENLLALLR